MLLNWGGLRMTGAAHHYDVVANDEGQLSIWRADQRPPEGWRAIGHSADEAGCLNWIEEHWVDRKWSQRTPGDQNVHDAAAIAAGIGPPGVDDARTICDLFEQIARQFPERRAVTFEDGTLSYAELERRSAIVARRLSTLGVGADDIVGVGGDPCLGLLATLLGVLRAGAAYLALDNSLPPRRVADMVDDASPKLILTDDVARYGDAAVPVLAMDQVVEKPESGAMPTVRRLHPDHLAYVIFTSGSTGRPKGVLNTHRAIRNRLAWMQESYPIDGADTVLQKTPLGFDVSVWELFWPLTVGAHQVLTRHGGHRDPDYLADLIATHRVTVVHFVPSMLRAFLHAGVMPRCTSLRHVICSGEALTPALRSQFFAVSGAALHNLYGPTEAAIDVTHYTCLPDRDPATVPIGLPISGVSVHVLGPAMEPVPADVVGEIYLGGIGLARGYVNQPAMTAARFVPDPHGPAGARLYRTGDLGRRRADGLVEFVGRVDNQVALRGFRIELGEVEVAIETVPGVRQAVVTMWRNESGVAGLTGYLLSDIADTELPALVREQVATRLLDHMIPTRWVVLTELPLLRSGKVDRDRLPSPTAATHAALPDVADGPWTDVERRVVAAWTQAMGTAPSGLGDDFFRCGGDSILAVELVVAARSLGLSLTVSTIFEHPTPGGLAAAADACEPVGDFRYRPFDMLTERERAALPETVTDAFPLSTLLSSLVTQSGLNPAYRVYTTSLALHGGFDEQLLRRTVRMLLHRHPFLRSSIDTATYEQPLQLVHAQVPDPVSVVDLRQLPPDRRAATFHEWFAAEPLSRFDWTAPPLLRVTAHRITDAEFRVTLTEPFLDGWSVTTVLSELLTLYRSGGDTPLPRAASVPAHHLLLIQERAAADDETSRSFWQRALAGAPGAALPRALAPVDFRVRTVPLDPRTCVRLRELAVDSGVSVKSVLLAAHLRVVALLTGRTDVVTGLITNCRPETDGGAQAVGMFLNTVPVRVDVSVRRARDLVGRVHAAEAATLRHRHYPYARMLRDANLTGALDTAFNYTHFRPYRSAVDEQAPRLTAIDSTDQTYHRLTAQFRMDVLHDAIALKLEFAAWEFDTDQMDRIAGYYAMALCQLADDPTVPGTPVDSLIGAVERTVLLDGDETEPAETVSPPDLFTLFADQVQRSPAATALWYNADRVTYAELAGRAETLAARLTECGVGPGSVVAVRLERSPAYVAAVLAALRVGATYLPIDSLHPEERVARMLAISAPAAVVEHGGLVDVRTTVVARTPVRDGMEANRGQAEVAPDSAAVMLFTSGSTGDPKGVLLPHTAIVNRLSWSAPAEHDVFLLRTPIGFSDAVAELFDGLLRGRPTVILPDAERSPDELVTLIQRTGVTRVTLVPTLLGEVLRLDRDLGHDLRTVRRWHLSGEPLRADLVRSLRKHLPRAEVCNLYGATEVAADATVFESMPGTTRAVVPVGAALPNVTVRVVHEDGGLVPVGTPGEVVVGGRGLALGYVSDPRATASRFRPAPTGRGGRAYRTGDLGARRADGVLELLGRSDRQVKVRGVRVEPAEVETNLVVHPAVDEAVVTQRELGAGPVLVGYVRTRRPTASLAGALRAFLRDRLPDAAVPARFVVVTDWPLLSSGKVDVAALPEPATEIVGGPGRAPTRALELRLAELWERELGAAPADVEDGFWSLGGHSLSAVLLARHIERTFTVPFTVRDLYDRPTLAAQVSLIERRRATRSDTDTERGSRP